MVDKYKAKIASFIKLRDALHVSKIATINELKIAHNIASNQFVNALAVRDIFSYIEKRYKMKSQFYSGSHKSKSSTLWILVLMPKSILSLSSKQLLQKIKNNYQKGDYIVTYGDEAKEFALKQKMRILVHYRNDEFDEMLKELAFIIYKLYISSRVDSIKFLLHSLKTKNEPVTILPIKDLKFISYEKKLLNQEKNYFFYPNLTRLIESLAPIYINSITQTILEESRFYVLKQKLLNHESSLSNIDKRIDALKLKINKERQSKLTEEIISISQHDWKEAKYE